MLPSLRSGVTEGVINTQAVELMEKMLPLGEEAQKQKQEGRYQLRRSAEAFSIEGNSEPTHEDAKLIKKVWKGKVFRNNIAEKITYGWASGFSSKQEGDRKFCTQESHDLV